MSRSAIRFSWHLRIISILTISLLLDFFSACTTTIEVDEGVSIELAKMRKQQLDNIIYNLRLDIPASKNEPINGQMKITFDYYGNYDVVLDFKVDESNVKSISSEKKIATSFVDGHIIVPASEFEDGQNELTIDFVAGDMSLNRNEEFLYTLFVPDRASTAFPLFDQPDLKAIYNLTLLIPDDWIAIANGELIAVDSTREISTWYFRETEPLSTYLFSFAAGNFKELSQERNGRKITMLHRETDTTKVNRNVEDIFDLHFKSLDWLEEYTGIPYPFRKFGFVLIPSFQYGGMEHPGAILYNSAGLFLESSYTQSQLLGRASVIAHETAHMWFGDLVTMEWFNDVWMKEVFANFMAAKIINPSFPEINHNLRFLMAHYPSAYSVDRTQGANPIQQKLDNLKNAGQMYGAIIYQKAPIVMRHLENFVGVEIFRNSMQEYLRLFSYGNANWDDLVNIIDRNSDLDVAAWSEAWVKEPGIPKLKIDFSSTSHSIDVTQNDALNLRPQPVSFLLIGPKEESVQKIFLETKQEQLTLNSGEEFEIIIPNPDGFSYGQFELTNDTKDYLLNHLSEISDPVLRGSSWIMLNEAMLNFELAPNELLRASMAFLPAEEELQNAQYILGVIGEVFWKFLPIETRTSVSVEIEDLLLEELEKRESSREKAMFLNSFINIATTSKSIDLIKSWWNGSVKIVGLSLSENDFTRMAYELAVRGVENADSILSFQLGRIKNPDRKQRMEFVIPALSQNIESRHKFFESLKSETNREHEPWVLEGLRYIHHPLRSDESINYLKPSLELLKEIQRTGDIFFPTRWLGSTFSGHSSDEALKIVIEFLKANPEYPQKLREKILQTTDDLLRAAEWTKRNTQSGL